MHVLALADDSTGALETGARLCAAGFPSQVRFSADLSGAGDALVIDTQTRHLPAETAAARIREIAHCARDAGVASIFKKTDSTLRGPLAAEFRALLAVWPERPLVYVPAYPALGRTVRDGDLYVDGVPLAQTAFAADPLNPTSESSVAAVLQSCGAEIVLVKKSEELPSALQRGRILICDSETEADLDALARAASGTGCLMAGTAAMVSAWAKSLPGARVQALPFRRGVHRCLIVLGSLHPASAAQLTASGIPTLSHSSEPDAATLGTRLARQLEVHRWVAVRAPFERHPAPLEIAAQAGRIVAQAVEQGRPDCLVVVGGDTVFAILQALNIHEAEPMGEILPGVAVSILRRPEASLLLVTKAGGFGDAGYLLRIREILERA